MFLLFEVFTMYKVTNDIKSLFPPRSGPGEVRQRGGERVREVRRLYLVQGNSEEGTAKVEQLVHTEPPGGRCALHPPLTPDQRLTTTDHWAQTSH